MKKYHFILFILLSCLFSCKKDNSPSPFTATSYPLAVGNWWQYQIDETYEGGGYDTITLSVISQSISGPYINYKCYYLYKGTVTDSGYFLQSDTSMSFTNAFYYPNFGSFPNFYLRFPANTGQYWQGSFPGDSILVEAVVGSEGYYGHTYSPCYLTNESYNLPHNYKVESMVLTPKVGLVHQTITFNSDTAGKTPSYGGGIQIHQSVDLINYHVQ